MKPMYVLAAILLVEGSAFAGASGTADVACGSAPGGWNAPNGAYVSNRGTGPIRAVIDAVGEQRTHTMTSHGAAQAAYVTHHTMHTPGTTGWPTYCSTPANPDELRAGYPGGSQVTQGGIYTHMYGNGGQEFAYYQRSNSAGSLTTHGADIANWTWSYFPYQWTTSRKDGGQGFYRLKNDAGQLLNYTLYQYRNLEAVNSSTASTWQNGMHCTTLGAHMHFRAGKGVISSHSYSHAQIVNAGNTLKNAVENDCNNSIGFWKGLGSSITCFENICDDAGRQVRNCMAYGGCDTDSDSGWNGIVNDGNAVATSISPDRLGGWSGHPWTGYNGQNGVSVWAYDNNQTLQYNQGGSSYSCWF
jgi:hypothetical protein